MPAMLLAAGPIAAMVHSYDGGLRAHLVCCATARRRGRVSYEAGENRSSDEDPPTHGSC